MDLRLDRAGALSPLEESSAEVSRDSGIVSQSASSLSMVSDAASGGSVSRSPSFAAAAAAASRSPSVDAAEPRPDPNPEQDVDEEVLRRTAGAYSSYVLPSARDEIVSLEKSLEEMLTRVDEFVGMLDMIRHDTSQVVNENLPQIHRKSEEMRQIYRKIDKLEYFVKMVDGNVHAMEEQVTQAEGEAGTLPGAFKKIFRTMSVPGFLNWLEMVIGVKPAFVVLLHRSESSSSDGRIWIRYDVMRGKKPASPKRTHHHSQELPTVFRTDDYFTSNADA